jgi:sugar lactone lactonase YvrE
MHLNNHFQTGALYRIDKDLCVRKVLDKQSIPNGIVWNKINTKMYYADSGRGCIEEYNYDMKTGEIQFLKVAIQVPPEFGVPDGMTIDAAGMIWAAQWGGFGVYCWNPENGELVDKVNLPVPNVASCTFIGENQLFVTTACSGLSFSELQLYPQSGSLFVVDIVALPGINHYPFYLK